jgi:hypothetical protein
VNLTLSPPIRIAALAGLVLVIVAGGASMMLGHSKSSAPTTSAHRTPVRTATTPAATKTPKTAKTAGASHTHAAATTAGATSAHRAEALAAAAAAVKAQARAKAKAAAARRAAARRGNLVDADLPEPLAWQLSQHKIVVVSTYDPQSAVDEISVAEAHAGAAEAGAGFLLVDVLNNAVAGLLTGILPNGGLLPDPGVLIYRAPGTLALRIDGFADRDAIAQAVADVQAGQNGPTDAPTTAAPAP